MSNSHSEWAGWLQSLEIEYHKRYQRKETEADLDTAIQQFLESIRLMSDDHLEWTC